MFFSFIFSLFFHDITAIERKAYEVAGAELFPEVNGRFLPNTKIYSDTDEYVVYKHEKEEIYFYFVPQSHEDYNHWKFRKPHNSLAFDRFVSRVEWQLISFENVQFSIFIT